MAEATPFLATPFFLGLSPVRTKSLTGARDAGNLSSNDDMVHGRQELAHAGDRCFQSIHIFEAGSGKPILSLLRPGKRPSLMT